MTPPMRDDDRFEREALCWLPDVARYALSLTRDAEAADDLVQDTFLSAYEHWARYEAGSDCRAWLFAICRHRHYRVAAREERQVVTDAPELEALAAGAIHAAARADGLDDVFERAEVRGAVEAAIEDLPAEFRDVAVLIDLHDQTYESAASILGVPVGTIRSRLFRARRVLQQRLIAHARDAGFGGLRGAPPTGGHGQ